MVTSRNPFLYVRYFMVLMGVFSVVSFSFAQQKEIKIGAIVPLTGSIATYGENIRDGILLAVDEINKTGGIKGQNVKVIFEDEGAGPQAAVTAAQKLIQVDRVQIIIGPATSNGVMAVAPIAEKNHVVIFTPSGTSDNIRDAGDYIFRNRASASQEASVFAKYILEDLKLKKFSILRSDANYANSFADVCKQTLGKKGKVLSEEVFSEGTTDLRSQIAKIKVVNPEAILIIGVPIELGNMLKQIKEIGLKALLFSNTIDSPDIFKIAEGAEEGLTFVTTFYDPEHGDKRIKQFDAKFTKRFGMPSHIFGANAYDAVFILAKVIAKYGYQGEKIKKGLYKIKAFKGASGITEFDEKGDLKFTKVAIKKISKGKFIFVKEVQK